MEQRLHDVAQAPPRPLVRFEHAREVVLRARRCHALIENGFKSFAGAGDARGVRRVPDGRALLGGERGSHGLVGLCFASVISPKKRPVHTLLPLGYAHSEKPAQKSPVHTLLLWPPA